LILTFERRIKQGLWYRSIAQEKERRNMGVLASNPRGWFCATIDKFPCHWSVGFNNISRMHGINTLSFYLNHGSVNSI